MQDSGFRIEESEARSGGFRIQDRGFRIEDSGSRIQDRGFGNLNEKSRLASAF
jgi:hypothetical protein